MKKNTTLHMVLAAMFTALGILLPIAFRLFGAGPIFLPMHIPVLLCGLIVGKRYGALVGFIVPLLSSTIGGGMPPLFPVAISMAFELAAYGFFAGLLYKKFKLNVFISLIGAMLAGRVVMAIANVILLGFAGNSYSFSAFIAGAFVTAWPGIVIQLILIPIILIGLEKTDVMQKL